MKPRTKIPFFQEFAALHAAFGLSYKEIFKEIDLFHYEDAKSCTEDISPYRNNFYQVFFIHHSELTGNYNDTHLHFTAKNAYLLFTCPGKLISWKRSSDLHGYIFSFKPSFFLPFMNNASFLRKFHFFNPDASIPLVLKGKKDKTLVMNSFRDLSAEYRQGLPDSPDILWSALLILLTHANRWFAAGSGPQPPLPAKKRKLLREFEALARKHLPERKSVKEYAALLNVTPKYLSETLKKESGKTAQAIMQEIVMLDAKSLLLQTELSIAEISRRLGFADPSHFARLFRSKTGKTPSAFIKKR